MVEAAKSDSQILFCKCGALPTEILLASFSPRGGVRVYTPIVRTETANEQMHNLCVHGSRVDSLIVDFNCTTEHILNTDQDCFVSVLLLTSIALDGTSCGIARSEKQWRF